MHLFEATWGMSSVLLMDMDGQEAFSSVSPHSEPAKAGSSVSQLSSGSSGPEELLPSPVCRLSIVPYSYLSSLVHLLPREGSPNMECCYSPELWQSCSSGYTQRRLPSGLVLYPSEPHL